MARPWAVALVAEDIRMAAGEAQPLAEEELHSLEDDTRPS